MAPLKLIRGLLRVSVGSVCLNNQPGEELFEGGADWYLRVTLCPSGCGVGLCPLLNRLIV